MTADFFLISVVTGSGSFEIISTWFYNVSNQIRATAHQGDTPVNLPDLQNWDNTRDCLHRVTQVIGEIRRLSIPSQPNALHLAVYVAPEGVTTGRLPDGSEYLFDFASAEVLCHAPDGDSHVLTLEGRTPRSLVEAALEEMVDDVDARHVMLEQCRITDEDSFSMDPELAQGYAELQYIVFRAIAHFKARLYGTMTPLVVWPHHFDLSFLWFKGHNPDEHTEPHMNFGFAPHSDGFDQPYLYFYAYPMPEGALDVRPPTPARWNTEGFTGIVLDYADLREHDNPRHLIEITFETIHAGLAPLL